MGQKDQASLSPNAADKDGEGDTKALKDPFRSFIPSKSVESPEPEPIQPVLEMEEAPEFDYSSLEVSGLLWGTDDPKAIINGDIVGKGDIINEAEVLDINKDGILFKYKGKAYLMKRNL